MNTSYHLFSPTLEYIDSLDYGKATSEINAEFWKQKTEGCFLQGGPEKRVHVCTKGVNSFGTPLLVWDEIDEHHPQYGQLQALAALL